MNAGVGVNRAHSQRPIQRRLSGWRTLLACQFGSCPAVALPGFLPREMARQIPGSEGGGPARVHAGERRLV